jgi:hypothetical protein
MDLGWLATIIVIVINIFGWGMAWGKLNGRVKSLETLVAKHDKIIGENGLMAKISDLASRCSGLEGVLQTYIELERGKK